MFYTYFGFISDNCWRRSYSMNHNDVCYCDTLISNPNQGRNDAVGAAQHIMEYLQVVDVEPPKNQIKIGKLCIYITL